MFVSVVVRLMRFAGRIGFHVSTQCRGMQRVFVGRVGFRFGYRLRRADQFLYFVLVVVLCVGVMLVVFVVMMMARFAGALILFVQMIFVLFVLFDLRRR